MRSPATIILATTLLLASTASADCFGSGSSGSSGEWCAGTPSRHINGLSFGAIATGSLSLLGGLAAADGGRPWAMGAMILGGASLTFAGLRLATADEGQDRETAAMVALTSALLAVPGIAIGATTWFQPRVEPDRKMVGFVIAGRF